MLAFKRKLRWVVILCVPLTILLGLAAVVLAEQRSGRTTLSNMLDAALVGYFFLLQVVALLYAFLVRPVRRIKSMFDFDRIHGEDELWNTQTHTPLRPSRLLSQHILRWMVLVLSPVCAAALVLALADEHGWLPEALYELIVGTGLVAAMLNLPAALLYASLVAPAAEPAVSGGGAPV